MFRKINENLENLFDQNSNAARHTQDSQKINPSKFQIESNIQGLENLSYIFSHEINADNLSNLFSQLSSYFEIGFLLKLNPYSQKYNLKEVFIFSKKTAAPENTKAIGLPAIEIYKVVKTRARPFLNHFDMCHYDSKDIMFSYLIPISDSYTIVVVTQVAEPWAKLKVEALQKTLMKINFSL